jgi:hypothetical protein
MMDLWFAYGAETWKYLSRNIYAAKSALQVQPAGVHALAASESVLEQSLFARPPLLP